MSSVASRRRLSKANWGKLDRDLPTQQHAGGREPTANDPHDYAARRGGLLLPSDALLLSAQATATASNMWSQ
jgi:hypothetical protein